MNNLYTNFEEFNESRSPYYDYATSIEKSDLITPKNYKNVFKMVVKNIGTSKTTLKTILLRDKEEVINIIDFCKWVSTHYDYVQIKKVGLELFGNKLKDFLEIDKTSYEKGVYCIPKIESVTYFDENGDEHKINIK